MSKTQPHKNHVVIASAGSRKTTLIVEEALKQKDKKVLVTTFTNENTDLINSYLVERNGCIPNNITVLSWFTFLLRDGVWPYQKSILSSRVESVDFQTPQAPIVRGGRANAAWYVNKGNYLYKDRVSEFICDCNSRCGGLVIKRLEKIYDTIYIDEMQDLVGWDQELVQLLMQSLISIFSVGDPRQATYSTNRSSKNKAQKGRNMVKWVEELEKRGLCDVEELTECFRCNQKICDFSDNLYPHLPKTKSKNTKRTGHDGIFIIKASEVPEYVVEHNPKILRRNIITDTLGLPAINIGLSKGQTFDRVVIFPTNPMKLYLSTHDLNVAGDLSLFYVAVTRARYSVAFVV